jgi:hypothetical protein
VNTIPDSLASALAGRYALERELGQGGMATVYLASVLVPPSTGRFACIQRSILARFGSRTLYGPPRVPAYS